VAAEYQAHYQQAIAQQQAQQRAQREQYLTAEISRFADGKDYWDKVQPEIERQIHGLKATDAARVEQDPLWALTEAHDRAVKQAGILTKEVAAERKRKADEAKRLASLNARSNGGQSPITASRNIWDNASWGAIYDRVNAGDR
jgi:hypothetical protein